MAAMDEIVFLLDVDNTMFDNDRLIADLIDKEQWTSLDADVKGDAYEGLLEKNAADVKGG